MSEHRLSGDGLCNYSCTACDWRYAHVGRGEPNEVALAKHTLHHDSRTKFPKSEHVPDTATVRSIFADYWTDEVIPSSHPLREMNRAEFDRWLAAEKEKAWDDGFDALRDELANQVTNPTYPIHRRNPYRAGETDG